MIKQEIFNDLTTVLGNKIIKKEDGFYFDDTKTASIPYSV